MRAETVTFTTMTGKRYTFVTQYCDDCSHEMVKFDPLLAEMLHAECCECGRSIPVTRDFIERMRSEADKGARAPLED